MIPTCDDIVIIEDFLSPDDCQTLIDTYDSKVFKSVVVGGGVHESRTSSTFYMPREDLIVKKLLEKTSQILNIPERNIEGLQFLRYLHGEQYKYHDDFLPGNNITNQRVYTVLVYLNTLKPEDGGATSFYYYKKKVVPKTGTAVLFKNMKDDGTGCNTQAMHAGETILTEGVVKYAINIWTRQHSWL
jgi:prolyl 4-hydroxylase